MKQQQKVYLERERLVIKKYGRIPVLFALREEAGNEDCITIWVRENKKKIQFI